VLFGGNANNGSNAGFVYANSNNVPSNTNANIGSRLYFTQMTKNNNRAMTVPLGKKIRKIQKGVGRIDIISKAPYM